MCDDGATTVLSGADRAHESVRRLKWLRIFDALIALEQPFLSPPQCVLSGGRGFTSYLPASGREQVLEERSTIQPTSVVKKSPQINICIKPARADCRGFSA
jgi:hypothetical protein